jgi:hypothetical protein
MHSTEARGSVRNKFTSPHEQNQMIDGFNSPITIHVRHPLVTIKYKVKVEPYTCTLSFVSLTFIFITNNLGTYISLLALVKD